MKIIPGEDDSDPLGPEKIFWRGFFPSLQVTNITPKFLPKKELVFEPDDGGEFKNCVARFNFSIYPSPQVWVRNERNNKFIEDGKGNVSVFTQSSLSYEFDWAPLSKGDFSYVSVPDEPDTRRGQPDPVKLVVEFSNHLELSGLELKYKIYGQHDPNPNKDLILPEPVPPKFDPSFKVTAIGPAGELVLVDKPEIDLRGFTVDYLERSFDFSATSQPPDFESMEISRIEIEIGKRDIETGLHLSQIKLKCLKLNDSASEDFISLESKHLITTGYYDSGTPTRQFAQSAGNLLGTVKLPDVADELESVGICEFFRPLGLELPEEGCRGKLRRHWANLFTSWDINKEAPSVRFKDGSVEESEARQGGIFSAALQRLDREDMAHMKRETVRYFVSPYDQRYLGRFNPDLAANLEGTTVDLVHENFDLESFSKVSKGSLPPGWQDEGFYACLDPATHIVNCIYGLSGLIGERHPTISYKEDHGLCTGNGGYGVLAPRLFDLPLFDRPGSLLGAGASVAGVITQPQLDPHSFSAAAQQNQTQQSLHDLKDKLLENRLDAIQQQIENYIKEKDERYQS